MEKPRQINLTYEEIENIKVALREAIGRCDEMASEEGIPPIRKHALVRQTHHFTTLLDKLEQY